MFVIFGGQICVQLFLYAYLPMKLQKYI